MFRHFWNDLVNGIIFKAILDQFRKGLSILGFLDKLEKSPKMFEHYFLHQGEEVTAEFVRGLLKTPDAIGQEHAKVVQMLLTFIENTSTSTLADFLYFATGSRSRTSVFLPGSVTVSVADTDSIFAATCLLSLKLPSSFSNYDKFKSSMMQPRTQAHFLKRILYLIQRCIYRSVQKSTSYPGSYLRSRPAVERLWRPLVTWHPESGCLIDYVTQGRVVWHNL